jgi:ubiquinone biosynthesis protein UbiJ
MNEKWLQYIEKMLNCLVVADPTVLHRLIEIHGKSIGFSVRSFAGTWQGVLLLSPQKIHCLAASTIEPNVRLSGTLRDWSSVMLALFTRKPLPMHRLRIEGEVDVTQILMKIMMETAIDWQGIYGDILGDFYTYHLSGISHHLLRVVKSGYDQTYFQLKEYFHEECDVLPHEVACRTFFDDVDAFVMDVDRLESRLLSYLTLNMQEKKYD